MDLNFYSDLTDGAGQHDDDPQFLDPRSFNGFDSDNKVIPPSGVAPLVCVWLYLLFAPFACVPCSSVTSEPPPKVGWGVRDTSRDVTPS